MRDDHAFAIALSTALERVDNKTNNDSPKSLHVNLCLLEKMCGRLEESWRSRKVNLWEGLTSAREFITEQAAWRH